MLKIVQCLEVFDTETYYRERESPSRDKYLNDNSSALYKARKKLLFS